MIAKVMNVKPPAPVNVGALPPGPNAEQMGGSFLQAAKDTANDLYTGGVKSFGRSIASISSGLNKLPWIGETLAPKVGVQSFQQQMQPDNTTQKIGGALEQAGEMALTGGPLRQGATTLAAKLPFLGRAALPAARVAAEAINTGGNAALHGESIAPAAAMGAGGAAVGEALPFVAPLLKKKAVQQYERALAPTTKQNKAIAQEIVPELINRSEYGSLKGLEQRAEQNVQNLSPQLDAQYQQLQGAQGAIPKSGNQVISDLEDLKKTYMPGGNIAQPQAVAAINGVQDIIRQYGPDVSPTNLRRLRQIFEEAPAQRGAYAGADLATNYTLKAQQAAADSIRGILNSSTSDIGKINKEISFWLDVRRVAGDSALRQTGQQGGLLKVLGPLGTALAGGAGFAAHGAGTGLEAAGSTALASLAVQVTRSPAWRTASAVAKDRFANVLARGSAGEIVRMASRFGVGLGTGQSNPQSAPQPTQ